MAATATVRSELKVVGKSGQIALGKRFVGKTLRLEERADGTLLLTAVAVVPESQLWTLQAPERDRIVRGMRWAAAHPPRATDVDAVVARASSARRSRRRGRR